MSEKKKCGCLCKIVKCALWCAVVVLLLVAALPLWISPVATGIAGSIVPKYTGTDFRIERFTVNPWTGTVRIGGVRLSNPDGFGDAAAFSLGAFSLEASLLELLESRVHILDLSIEDAFASYYSSNGTNNIDLILANVDRKLGPKDEKEKDSAAEDKEDAKSEIKVVIDHLRISGTKVKLMKSDVIPALPIATIELRDIGKESGGATAEEVWQVLSDAFVKGLSSVGDGVGALGGIVGGGVKDVSSVLGGTATSVTEGLSKVSAGALRTVGNAVKVPASASGDAAATVTDGAKSSGSAVGDAAKATGSAIGDAAKATGSAVGGAVKTTGAAIGDGASAAVNAVGDTTKKVTDGVKGIFKGFSK